MSRSVSMQFGKSGGVVQNKPGLKFLRGADVTDNTTEVISFAPGGMYLLSIKVWKADTGAYRGHALFFIAAPEESVFGTVAIARATAATGGTISLTLTDKSDSTLSIVQSGAAYNWRYALYRIDSSGGSMQESTIEPYTGTYSVTPTTSAQSLSTANKRMTADVEVEEIPVEFGEVEQSGTDLSIS